jgi:F-type H+-transporting ATPase subunit delta
MKGSAIAKKYVNALMKSCSGEELKQITQAIEEISSAFSSTKFNNIILSPDFSSVEKEKFVLSLVDISNTKLENFVKLLTKNDRLGDIPAILKELKYQIALKNNTFEGNVISNFEIAKEQIVQLEESFSKKFNSQIKLNSVVSNYPGIKIELDDLGVEVSFSLDRLKSQMVEHILKAI